MPLGDESVQFVDWMIHMDTIAVRGDGYQVHVYEIFKEMFCPHTPFYQQQFGYSVEQLFDFFMDLENRVICKIDSQETIYGAIKMYDRWKKWEEDTFGPIGDEATLENRDSQKVYLVRSLKQTQMYLIQKMVCNSLCINQMIMGVLI